MDDREILVLAETFGLGGECVTAIRQLIDRAQASTRGVTTPGGPAIDSRTTTELHTLPDSTPAPLPDRYEDLGTIGRGGMGEVRRVRDRLLERTLAMKIVLPGLGTLDRVRFLEEAQIAAQLQHPGIVPVHDFGELGDGRLWFTMKEVRGRTLAAVIDELHGAARDGHWAPTSDGWTFRRLVDAFQRACEAVAYAHSRRVVHRDLKPQNIMVGEYGEVFVMDWGLAKALDGVAAEDCESRVVSGPRETGDLLQTAYGQVLGTVAYMPPEQARGETGSIGPASDAYALGGVLYHLLSGRPPLTGPSAWARLLMRDAPPPLETVVPDHVPEPPPELAELCRRAMEREPEARPADARELAQAVSAWLDGARKRERALEVVQRAAAIEPAIAEERAQVEALRAQAADILGPLPDHAPAAEKIPGWRLEDEATERERAFRRKQAELEQTLQAALAVEPELPEAHAQLADLYRRRLKEADAVRDANAALHWEALLRAHDDGRYAAFLSGEGAVSLLTEPPGARVEAFRFEERDRRLVPVPVGALGTTPLVRARLPRGSYLLRLTLAGHVPVDYPVVLERQTHWSGRDPDGRVVPVRLLRDGDLGRDDVYVPGGWFWSGGDPFAADSLPRRRLWVDSFVIRRYPVTEAEVVDFLNALVAEGRGAEAAAIAAPEENAVGQLPVRALADGRYVFVEGARRDLPAVRLDWRTAAAYAGWLARRTGLPWRLPHELEWEKAARGVDGRFYPWGDQPETTWACVLNCRPTPPERAPLDAFPEDVSPYGVRHMAGNVREPCLNAYRRAGPEVVGQRVIVAGPDDDDEGLRSVRGGAWGSTVMFARTAVRFGGQPDQRYMLGGVRLARSV